MIVYVYTPFLLFMCVHVLFCRRQQNLKQLYQICQTMRRVVLAVLLTSLMTPSGPLPWELKGIPLIVCILVHDNRLLREGGGGGGREGGREREREREKEREKERERERE